MSLTFSKEFKEKILSGEKIATIRNSKHYNVGTIFKLNIGSRFKPDNIGKAGCRALFKTETSRFLHYLKYHIKTKENTIPFWDNIGIALGFLPTKLGFNNLEEAYYFYKTYLKNKYCYLHIFEVIED